MRYLALAPLSSRKRSAKSELIFIEVAGCGPCSYHLPRECETLGGRVLRLERCIEAAVVIVKPDPG
ncbi:MAG TPA: hypothetical protein VME66_03710 [Candidatus Acidoferrales bacterium]|nr:hypothetical protein [Candidatus Acidoferrales bacterium]